MKRLFVVSLFAALALILGLTLGVSGPQEQGSWRLLPGRIASAATAAVPPEAPEEPAIRAEPVAEPSSLRNRTPARDTHDRSSDRRAEMPRHSVRVAQASAPALILTPTPPLQPPVYTEGVYTVARRGDGLVYRKGFAAGAPVHVVQADLRDPEVKVGVVVAKGGIGRSERFPSMINRTTPAAAITGTFFGLRNGLPTGDIVVNGRAVFRGFIGTALAITDGNVVSFIPTDYKETPHWGMFDTVVRGGPRLVLAGQIAVNPTEEGFLTLGGSALRSRTAIGITPERKLLLVTVKEGVTLRRLAMAMHALGAYHAVALDGGTSTAMSFGGRIIAQPGRALTNLIVVYSDRERYERSRKHFYYHARRRVLPSGPPSFAVEPSTPPAVGEPGALSPAPSDAAPAATTPPPGQAAPPAGEIPASKAAGDGPTPDAAAGDDGTAGSP